MKRKPKPKGKITSKIASPVRIVFNPHCKEIVEQNASSFRVRRGKYAHFCFEWDEMLIDENDPEFEACNCGKPNPRS